MIVPDVADAGLRWEAVSSKRFELSRCVGDQVREGGEKLMREGLERGEDVWSNGPAQMARAFDAEFVQPSEALGDGRRGDSAARWLDSREIGRGNVKLREDGHGPAELLYIGKPLVVGSACHQRFKLAEVAADLHERI